MEAMSTTVPGLSVLARVRIRVHNAWSAPSPIGLYQHAKSHPSGSLLSPRPHR